MTSPLSLAALAWLALADPAPSAEAAEPAPEVELANPGAADVSEGAAPTTLEAPPAPRVTLPQRRKSVRTERELELKAPIEAAEPRPDAPPKLDLLRPDLLAARSPAGGAALGALVGFGTGYYYAGETRSGVVFSVLDTLAVGGLLGVTVALNEEVARNDHRTGASLARGRRSFEAGERALFIASWALVGLKVVSRAVQGVGGYRAAQRTNAALDGYSVIPLR